jgi:hypothetical protein
VPLVRGRLCGLFPLLVQGARIGVPGGDTRATDPDPAGYTHWHRWDRHVEDCIERFMGCAVGCGSVSDSLDKPKGVCILIQHSAHLQVVRRVSVVPR